MDRIWGSGGSGVTTAVLDPLSGFVAENEKHGHVMLTSLLIRGEEKLCNHATRYQRCPQCWLRKCRRIINRRDHGLFAWAQDNIYSPLSPLNERKGRKRKGILKVANERPDLQLGLFGTIWFSPSPSSAWELSVSRVRLETRVLGTTRLKSRRLDSALLPLEQTTWLWEFSISKPLFISLYYEHHTTNTGAAWKVVYRVVNS